MKHSNKCLHCEEEVGGNDSRPYYASPEFRFYPRTEGASNGLSVQLFPPPGEPKVAVAIHEECWPTFWPLVVQTNGGGIRG